MPGRGGDRKMGQVQGHLLTHLLARCLYHASQGWEEGKVRPNVLRGTGEDSHRPPGSTYKELKGFGQP